MALIGYWKLRTNLLDEVGTNHFQGSATFSDCLNIISNYYETLNDISFGSSERTIVFELKHNTNVSNDCGFLSLGTTGYSNCFTFNYNNGLSFAGYGNDSPLYVVKPQIWHKIVMRYKGTDLTVLVNGIQYDFVKSLNTGASKLRLGAYNWSSTVQPCQIRELRLYNNAITDDEMKTFSYDVLERLESIILNLYTKNEVDLAIQSALTGGVSLSDYYTKSEVDTALTFVTVDLSDYYKKSEFDIALTGLTVDLSQYYNKQYIDSIISFLATKEEIPNISQFLTETQINNILFDYVLKSNLKDDSVYIENNSAEIVKAIKSLSHVIMLGGLK